MSEPMSDKRQAEIEELRLKIANMDGIINQAIAERDAARAELAEETAAGLHFVRQLIAERDAARAENELLLSTLKLCAVKAGISDPDAWAAQVIQKTREALSATETPEEVRQRFQTVVINRGEVRLVGHDTPEIRPTDLTDEKGTAL